MWEVDTAHKLNTATDDYATKLTGSSASLDTLNLHGHVITFMSITEEDSGKYFCQVGCGIGSDWFTEFSPLIEITVKGKYN